MEQKRFWYVRGLRDGLPVGMGYLAVSFTLGIAAKNAGIGAAQAGLMSLLNLTSAGEFAALAIIQAQGSYMELVFSQLVINLRYCLMSCALSQKLSEKTPFFHRLFMAFGVTDEIFGIAVSTPKHLNPFYQYGAMSVAIPGWTIGTVLGVISGSILPAPVMRAMSLALYGMFLAIIIPPAKKSRILAGIVLVSMLLSLLVSMLPIVSSLSGGMKTIILTVGIAGVAAVLFPVKEEKETEAE
ncbi:MAG: AzlC family ABC transporter permease [Lachnospiraceae bacterium]|nr:AzlC family ABC transporter permease [Lachnospiraceae bacterium]